MNINNSNNTNNTNIFENNIIKIGVIGTGFVGNAIVQSLTINNISNIILYDKYINGGIGNIKDTLKSNIIFICLPTPYLEKTKKYDISAIEETLEYLYFNNFTYPILIKSTILPETTNILNKKFPSLQIIHNPEFLSQNTAISDFHNQKHIVLGKSNNCSNKSLQFVVLFYEKYYPNAKISQCDSNESECMKIFCNSFYAVKIQFFNELYSLCNNNDISFNNVKNLMLKNGWISPMHTNVPGNDGQLSYGGNCFPKDTTALLNYMKRKNCPNKVLEACINERNSMRTDFSNYQKQKK
jgi:UDPglucose 6-dehydrogenase